MKNLGVSDSAVCVGDDDEPSRVENSKQPSAMIRNNNCATDMVKLESDMPSSVAAGACPFSRNQSVVKVTESAVILSNLDQ